jgi:hypothetical protein
VNHFESLPHTEVLVVDHDVWFRKESGKTLIDAEPFCRISSIDASGRAPTAELRSRVGEQLCMLNHARHWHSLRAGRADQGVVNVNVHNKPLLGIQGSRSIASFGRSLGLDFLFAMAETYSRV